MSTKANPPPTHHRKPKKGHPWTAQGEFSKTKRQRANEPAYTGQKPMKSWSPK